MPPISPKWALAMLATMFIVVALLVDRGLTWWNTRQAVEQAVAPVAAKVEATAAINADAAKADVERQETDQVATKAATTYRSDIARGRANEPTTRDRADRPVPASVRDAFRKRRITIERSGCVGADCGEEPAGTDPPEREGLLR